MAPQSKGMCVRARASARYRYLFLLGTLCGGGFLLLSVHNGAELLFVSRDARTMPLEHRPHTFDVGNPFTIDTEGCTIPGLKPFDNAVKEYAVRPQVKLCQNYSFSVESNNTHIWIKPKYYQTPDGFPKNISCCYKSFYRPPSVEDIETGKVDNRVEYNDCIYFTRYIEVLDEFVKVECQYDQWATYEQFFVFTPKKPIITRTLIEDPIPQARPGYNVIIMGLDAISRLNFHRTMPKTLEYLRMKGAIELMGYNKVGDNTFPNLTPLLLGIRDVELHKTCWPHTAATFDNCPFIWEWFKDVGYYTALGEDSSMLGTFNYEKLGFVGTPTDYYLRTFMHEAEKHTGNVMDFNSLLCMGNKYFYQVLLDYVERLTSTLKSSKLFGFFWEVTMSHDYLNYPMHMDIHYENFLKNLDSSHYLDNTILIFLSDHGIRWGEIRYTKQGRLEERLPLSFILLPASFKTNYNKAYENLRINSRRLTTPFDLHAMLVDLVTMTPLKEENLKRRMEMPYAHERSISLFLPVPKNRTCKMADIDDHWCTCHKGQKTATDSGEVSEAGAHLVRYLNSLLTEHPHCARLKLSAVLEATELVAMPGSFEDSWREYMVVVRTDPGGGVFEATLRHEAGNWTLAGTVSRLNLYGEQSHCVHHYRLKLYCYCQ